MILETVENLSSDLRAASGYLADGNERGVVALMTSRPDQSQPPPLLLPAGGWWAGYVRRRIMNQAGRRSQVTDDLGRRLAGQI